MSEIESMKVIMDFHTFCIKRNSLPSNLFRIHVK